MNFWCCIYNLRASTHSTVLPCAKRNKMPMPRVASRYLAEMHDVHVQVAGSAARKRRGVATSPTPRTPMKLSLCSRFVVTMESFGHCQCSKVNDFRIDETAKQSLCFSDRITERFAVPVTFKLPTTWSSIVISA